MTKKETEHLIEVCDSILNLLENFSPHTTQPNSINLMFNMMYEMIINSTLIMQNSLYIHRDLLEENEVNNPPPTLDTHTATND
jgi:hypothetical protein